jgi:hypothetical protein
LMRPPLVMAFPPAFAVAFIAFMVFIGAMVAGTRLDRMAVSEHDCT